MPMRVAVGSDHAGFELKQAIKELLGELGHEVRDFGAHSRETCDYPDFARAASLAVASGEADLGVLVCGTGVGMSIAANKVPGVRAALCHDVLSARLTREHNDSNVLCLGQQIVGRGLALEIVRTWLGASFAGGRHRRRVDKIRSLEGLRPLEGLRSEEAFGRDR